MKRFQEAFKGSDKFYLADPEKVTIKKNTIIGGGAFVNKNCDSNSTYFGVPAKKIKT